jgi:hypothetical protein
MLCAAATIASRASRRVRGRQARQIAQSRDGQTRFRKGSLIVAHEVTNEGVDRDRLSSMAQKAKDAIGAQELTVVADRGYFKSEQNQPSPWAEQKYSTRYREA